MSVRVSAWAWTQPLGATAKLVLLAVSDQADDHGRCWPGQATLAHKCGLALRTVAGHLDALEADGYISRERRHRKDGARTSDLITVCLPADFAGGPGPYRQTTARLRATDRKSYRQLTAVPLKSPEPSEEPSGEPGTPRRTSDLLKKAMRRC